MKKILLLAAFAAAFQTAPTALAQNAVYTLHGLGPLQTENAFVGYYMLVQTDKPEKDKVKYQLSILDPALNRVASKVLVEDEAFKFAGSAFDGSHILIKYLGPPSDEKEERAAGERQLVRIYDTKLNQVKTRTNAIGKLLSEQTARMNGRTERSEVYPSPGGGFVSLNLINSSSSGGFGSAIERQGYSLEYIPTSTTAIGWRYRSPEKVFEMHHFIGQSPKQVYVSTMEKEKLIGYNFDYNILGFDRSANGRKSQLTDEESQQYSLVPARASYIPQTGQTLVSGVYFNKSKVEAFAKSVGLFAFTTDSTGKTVAKTFIPWKDVAQTAGAEEEGKLYIEHAVRVPDGRIFLVGERFRTGASASVGNIISRANTMGTTGTKRVNVGDFAILEMTPDLKLQRVHNFAKPGRDFELLSAIGAPSTEFQLHASNSTMDYLFAQQSTDGSSFIVYYILPKSKTTADVGALVYSNGKFTQDKLPITSKAEATTLLPNVFGSVGIFEYEKKEKRMDSRVVKVNY